MIFNLLEGGWEDQKKSVPYTEENVQNFSICFNLKQKLSLKID